MTTLAKIAAAALLLAVAAFCAFGFLATFEPPGFLALRLVYAAGAALCALAAVWLLIGLGARTPPRR